MDEVNSIVDRALSALKFRREDWEVRACPLDEAQEFIRIHHYAKGGSNTAVCTYGLYFRNEARLMGCSWWLPPTKVAAQSVLRDEWQTVLGLTRLAISPEVPKNAVSFLLGKSIREIRKLKKWKALVTYADESQGHTGGVYRASNWTYVGRTGPYPRWVDADGKQVAVKATVSRTKSQMVALGHSLTGKFHKHKYVYFL